MLNTYIHSHTMIQTYIHTSVFPCSFRKKQKPTYLILPLGCHNLTLFCELLAAFETFFVKYLIIIIIIIFGCISCYKFYVLFFKLCLSPITLNNVAKGLLTWTKNREASSKSSVNVQPTRSSSSKKKMPYYIVVFR